MTEDSNEYEVLLLLLSDPSGGSKVNPEEHVDEKSSAECPSCKDKFADLWSVNSASFKYKKHHDTDGSSYSVAKVALD